MPGSFRFGEFELDVDAYELREAGARVKLERVPMELLTVLVARAGTLVDRVEIHRAIWGEDVHVERDPAINTAIRKLRQALRDDPERPAFVETVVGKGYRFVAAVQGPPSPQRHVPGCVLRRGTQEFVLRGGENLLGRDPEAIVYLEDPSISRRHARIVIRSGTATLEDLDSRNGTFVDGRRITGAVELRHGAIVGVGPITLTFAIPSAPASTRPLASRRAGEIDEAEV